MLDDGAGRGAREALERDPRATWRGELHLAWSLVPDKKGANDHVHQLLTEYEAAADPTSDEAVPLSVAVAAVEAMQQAATTKLATKDACEVQMAQVKARIERGGMQEKSTKVAQNRLKKLGSLHAEATKELDGVRARYEQSRVETISRYTPKLVAMHCRHICDRLSAIH